MRLFALVVCLAGAAWLSACGGGSSEGLNVGEPEGDGALILTRIDGIIELSLESAETRVLIASENASEFFLDVAVSPDGERIAYVMQPPAQTIDGRYDAGSDLWIADRDGSNRQLVFAHEQPSQLVRYPEWDGPDHLLAIIQEYSEDADGLTVVDYTVQRVAIATGARERLLDDALTYTLRPGGAQLAYARLSPLTGEVLEVVDLPPGAPRTLVDTEQNLSPFNSPRYSPDGQRIAFAAADQGTAPPPPPGSPPSGGARPPSGAPRSPGLASPIVDGLPQDIWVMDAEGGAPAQIAPLQEDFPSLTWNGDGTHIYVIGAYGLYDVNVENGNWTRIGEGAFHGAVDWAP